MTSCNVEMTSCKAEPEKTRKNSIERHDSSNQVNVLDHDPVNKSYLIRNTLERDTSVETPINDSLESEVTDSQCNLESNCSQKKKKKKKNPKIKQNAKIHGQVDTSIKDDSTGTISCHESVIDADSGTDFKIAMTSELSQSQKKGKRKRKNQKPSATEISEKAHVPITKPDLIKVGENALISGKQSDSPTSPSTNLIEKHDDKVENGILEPVADTSKKTDLKIAPIKVDSAGTNSCHESIVDADTSTNFKISTISELSHSQKKGKRKRKKQKLSTTEINDKAHVPVAELDLIKMEENALVSGKQSDSPTSPSASLMEKHDDKSEYGILESVADTSTKTDLKVAPRSELSRSQRKRIKKKKKRSAPTDNDKAHVPVAEPDLIKVRENALFSEKQSDSPTTPCTSLTKKHDDNDEAGLLESLVDFNTKTDFETAPHSELGCSRKKRKRKKEKLTAIVIDDKPQVPLAASDLVKVGENALTSEAVSGCPRSPSSNLLNKLDNKGEAGILVEKENIKTHQMKGNIGTYGKRRHSSDSEENVKSINVIRLASSDLNEVHSFELSENKLQRVQAGEQTASVKIVENVVNENTSTTCSSGDLGLVESKNIIEVKKDADLQVPMKEDILAQVSRSSLEEPCAGCSNKKLLILDVNGLLADIVPYNPDSRKPDIVISRKAVYKRPFCDDFLQFCFEKFNVGVWSSRTKKNVDMVVDFLIGDSRHKLLFCWHQSHCTDTGFTTVENLNKPLLLKELKKLWDKYEPDLPWNKGEYNESNTLLLDDSPYKALKNPAHTAIFPHSYRWYKDGRDSSLGPGGDLRVYLERIAEAQNVQEFVAQNPFGQRAITEANPSWGFYQRILSSESCKTQNVATSTGMEQ